ncbi:isochorismatase family protein, partial [Escherichia coli]|uniref:isochorismatase family protein n=1 Tax=Escherichia coli TaxID=562 RepID=UPI001806112A
TDVPGPAPCALLLIDVINDLEFDGGERLLRRALPMARKLAALVERARKAHVPIVYVNDNFGRWRSDFRAQVQH